MTFALNNLGRHAEARTIAREGLRVAEQGTSDRYRGLCHFALGHTAMTQGEWAEAVPQFHRAAHYMQRLNHQRNLAVIYNNLGIIYQQQKLHDRAIAQFRKAQRIHQNQKGSERDMAIALFNIATNYGFQDSLAAARRYYTEARRWMDPRRDLDLLTNWYSNLGQQFLHEAEQLPIGQRRALYDSSFRYHQMALERSRRMNHPVHELHELHALAQVHNLRGEYAQARPLLDQALRMVGQAGNDATERRAIYRQYALLNAAQGRYRDALTWNTRYEALQDSLDNQQTKQLLHEYEVKLRQAEARQKLAENQRRIEQLESDRKRQNLWLGLAGVGVLAAGALLVVGGLYYRQRQRANANALLALEHQQALGVVQAELQGQQKERLRISKEIHDDLGASLTAIGLLSEVVKTRSGPAATPEVHKISDLSAEMVTTMNEIIWALNTRNDSLNGLIAYIRSYAREFAENTGRVLAIETEEAAQEISIRGADRRNVFLTVKEALHNAVKHAGASRLTLRIQAREELVIEIGDDGRGFQPDALPPHRNGLTNMKNRMREAGGTCEISSGSAGTSVRLTYPYPTIPAEKILQT